MPFFLVDTSKNKVQETIHNTSEHNQVSIQKSINAEENQAYLSYS